ncbi:MAG TPA: FAD-dependent monooxygenase [Caulobacteraceae bacterium]|nr:FAD-dependent monooxygenase [Caulobacteraceae bacterium]
MRSTAGWCTPDVSGGADRVDVLIVGAGPTGLALALWLARLGVGVRIIDENDGPGSASRAFAVQARTLEFYDQIGLADAAIGRGRKVAAINVHRPGRETVRIAIGDFGKGLSPFPFVLILLQDQHEKLLIGALAEAGIEVERNTALVDFAAAPDGGAEARLRGPLGATTTCRAHYLCGCDGVRSTVREAAGIPFDGGEDAATFYVADVRARGPLIDGELHYVMADDQLLSVFPLPGADRARLIGLVPPSIQRAAYQVTFADIAQSVADVSGLRPDLIEWFSTYGVHHRIARRFKRADTFLLGDAAHTHSPSGGQGLNTGIGDAVNLAWKLAQTTQGDAAAALLNSYDVERRGVARRIMRTTDRGLLLQVGRGAPALLRDLLVDGAGGLMAVPALRRTAFRTISQIGLGYRSGPAGATSAAAGDRLPWFETTDGTSNFDALKSLAWQAHVYGRPFDGVTRLCAAHGLPLHAFAWVEAAHHAGLKRDALYLVRPDGYLAFVSERQDEQDLERAIIANLGPRPAAAPVPPAG